MNKLFLIIFLFLTSCGVKTTIDSAFTSYVQDFEFKIGVPVANVDIYFKKLTYPTIGVCYRGSVKNVVQIDPDQWNLSDDYGKEQTIFHELGHCVLGLQHNDARATLDNQNVEGSIMNTYFFGNKPYYIKYHENYKQALKTNTLVKGEK
jgi:hypothetical protein